MVDGCLLMVFLDVGFGVLYYSIFWVVVVFTVILSGGGDVIVRNGKAWC